MSRANSRKQSLLTQIKAMCRVSKSNQWFNNLDSETQAELLAIRQDWQNGGIKQSMRQVHDFLNAKIPEFCHRSTFSDWMKREESKPTKRAKATRVS